MTLGGRGQSEGLNQKVLGIEGGWSQVGPFQIDYRRVMLDQHSEHRTHQDR